jgi:hypothetical protein
MACKYARHVTSAEPDGSVIPFMNSQEGAD